MKPEDKAVEQAGKAVEQAARAVNSCGVIKEDICVRRAKREVEPAFVSYGHHQTTSIEEGKERSFSIDWMLTPVTEGTGVRALLASTAACLCMSVFLLHQLALSLYISISLSLGTEIEQGAFVECVWTTTHSPQRPPTHTARFKIDWSKCKQMCRHDKLASLDFH